MKQRAMLSCRVGGIPLGWRATLFLPVALSAISCERLPTTAGAPSRPSFAVVAGSGSWTTKAPMPTARFGLGVAAVNGILYAVGGSGPGYLATLEAYDPVTNTWTTKAPMPTGRYGLGAAVVNGTVYAVGGYNGGSLATVEAYDPVTNTWTTQAPMPTKRNELGVAAVNGIVYAVGGITYSGHALATVEAYDPLTNTWTTQAPMPTARNGLGVAAVNGVLYAVGGFNGSAYVATLEAYDPATNTWTTRAPMPAARYDLGVAAVNGMLYAVGGCANTGCPSATLEAYDPTTDKWTTQAPMPTARYGLGVDAIIGTLYAVGGYSSGGPSAANEAFTSLGPPATLTLSPLTATNTVGTQHCVTATVQDAAGNPVPGVTVRFSVGPSVPTTFPSPSSGSSPTNASGQATFCYTASLPGVDRIHAFADANGNGTQDPTEPFGDAEKTWTPPVSTQQCEVTITDGGWIIATNNDRANFGGNAKVLADGTVQGQQQYQDHGPAQPMDVHSTQITATTCSQDRTTASIYGKATIDGAGSHVFRIDVTDAGSGGSNDTYGISLDTGYMSGQHLLGGGNITIH